KGAISINGYVEAYIEEFLLSLLKVVAQTFEVLVGHIEHGVADKSFGFSLMDLALYFCHLLLELLQDLRSFDGMDEYGNIEDAVEVDDRSKPTFAEKTRI